MQFEVDRDRPDLKAFKQILGGGLIWVGLAFLVIAGTMFYSIRVAKVTGEQVGIKLNKITGKMTVINQSGAIIYNGITNQFFTLDKTLQTLEMTETRGEGDRAGKDDLKIKTVDGSDVFVDLKVQYRMLPDMADTVIKTSGPGEAYKMKWARDHVRSLVRNALGELTTEEFYDAALRDGKLLEALNLANSRLEPFGLHIDTIVVPREPHFYAEYEEMIKKKKLADQAVLEEQSKALAAKQLQETMIVEETNRVNVAVEQFSGEMDMKKIKATAEAEQAKKEADAYYDKVTIGAQATLYEMEKKAQGILATRQKEAEGLKELMLALEGQGGPNMVKLEYAKKLKGVTISGQPVSYQGQIPRLQHMYVPTAIIDGKK